ncbi:substrate-binding domain-containing protein [Glycomyces sp. TRM65418]|uniref:sugar ABC transporter substrate-binding protein n=1 Tax=Glycomyces sp. TRM65418 TaxID=2867006 RepID=UPI001CE5D74D|nr:substrate-binding domain-containing protein [Glycomyces sp. TRM65418]MCC3765006.1 substrate-binding domain-containing protein [Glycomyces sp. TRM65418]QZD54636.1 substrate-binding domain-containing protein [Glycomyces sp. TRM65418]
MHLPSSSPTRSLAAAAAGATLVLGLAACGGGEGGDSGGEETPLIGVILPDSASSDRWETADRRYLEAAFEAAGVDYDIQNAQGSREDFQTIADQMLTKGVDVLITVNLDSGTGATVIEKAKSQGVATIDYDRLTEGGGADYYVSFDNERVGVLQGEGLVACLEGVANPLVAELNGSPTDNNATLFKRGYDSVLDPLYESGALTKGPDEWVPDWDNAQGGTLFEQMLTDTGTEIDGVLAANDGLAHAVITVLERNNLNGTVPVTGQDATVQGLQNILAGDQCMTVYKAIEEEANAAADLAVALANGEKPSTDATVVDPVTEADVPAVLLEPVAITIDNIQLVVDDGYADPAELCAGEFAALCTEHGIG